MKILVTGAAGFIGSAVARRLVSEGHDVLALDSFNNYYDPRLKLARVARLGYAAVSDILEADIPVSSAQYPSLRFVKADIADHREMERLFGSEQFEVVINLAAQAGVRYSLENPRSYIRSNIDGFLNILEGCRNTGVRHLLYASSSSVYGADTPSPYSEDARADAPVSLYAATKRSDELMASCYSRLYGIPATALRFFTVYGPWGRPDMAPFIFLSRILAGKKIKVFNHGHMMRDFTYIDDVVESVCRLIELTPGSDPVPHRILNVGNSSPVELMDFIAEIERVSGRKADIRMEPMQPGDVPATYADTSRLQALTGYRPSTPLSEGIALFADWYRSYYHI